MARQFSMWASTSRTASRWPRAVNANDAAIIHNAAAPDEPLTLEAIQCGGDGGNGAESAWARRRTLHQPNGKDFEEANVVSV